MDQGKKGSVEPAESVKKSGGDAVKKEEATNKKPAESGKKGSSEAKKDGGDEEVHIGLLDIRVGTIVKVQIMWISVLISSHRFLKFSLLFKY